MYVREHCAMNQIGEQRHSRLNRQTGKLLRLQALSENLTLAARILTLGDDVRELARALSLEPSGTISSLRWLAYVQLTNATQAAQIATFRA